MTNLVTHRKSICLMNKLVRFCRLVHTVRVRFAPSPTGNLHLGGLRTALYNYLFAKKNGGSFILRIEDTDQTRVVNGAESSIIEDLVWAGLEFDEGPSIGGNYGPYVQSQRIHLYKEYAQKLLQNGTAYRCFCTQTRLDMLRNEALKLRQVPKYDNKCRHISSTEIEQKLKNNSPFCLRFKMVPYPETVIDLIYGNNLSNYTDSEGDPVIMKSDGYPTYHLANVIDDHLMKISHVFRGVEWQMSTSKHLLLYKAFDWSPPQYGHLPLLVNADGTKLSKRQGDIRIKRYRDHGIFPLSLVNYVISAGGGFRREQSDGLSIHSIEELSKMFNVSNLNSHPNRLNSSLLNELNNMEITRRLSNETETEALIDMVKDEIDSKYPRNEYKPDRKYIRSILKWSAKRLSTISDLVSEDFCFLWTDGDTVHTENLTNNQILELINCLDKIEFSKEIVYLELKAYSTKTSIKFSELMKTLRVAISGQKNGPGVAEIMELLGKNESLRRVRSNLRSTKKL